MKLAKESEIEQGAVKRAGAEERGERQRQLNICAPRSLEWPALAGQITGLLQSRHSFL